MSGTYTSRLVTFVGHNTKTSNQNWDRIPNWLFPPVFLSCGRSISWICWCFYTFSSLTVSKVHCSFIERLMLKEYLIKCFIVRYFRKSYFWCCETSNIFFSRISIFPSSRETSRFKRILIFNFVLRKKKWNSRGSLRKHPFLRAFLRMFRRLFQRVFFSEEKIICLCFKIEWAGKWRKTFVSNFLKCANDNRQEQVTVQTVVDAVIHA